MAAGGLEVQTGLGHISVTQRCLTKSCTGQTGTDPGMSEQYLVQPYSLVGEHSWLRRGSLDPMCAPGVTMIAYHHQ